MLLLAESDWLSERDCWLRRFLREETESGSTSELASQSMEEVAEASMEEVVKFSAIPALTRLQRLGSAWMDLAWMGWTGVASSVLLRLARMGSGRLSLHLAHFCSDQPSLVATPEPLN